MGHKESDKTQQINNNNRRSLIHTARFTTLGSGGAVWRLGGSGQFRCTALGPGQEAGTHSQGSQRKPQVMKQDLRRGKMRRGTERAVNGHPCPSFTACRCGQFQ